MNPAEPLVPKLFPSSIFARFFDRSFDVRDEDGREKLRQETPFSALFSANQTHSKHVFVIDEAAIAGVASRDGGDALQSGRNSLGDSALPVIENVDAFVTNLSGVGILIKTADCQPILICDPVKNVVAGVHSGWRGSVQNITGETIRVLREHYGCDPRDLLVSIGPSLGPCCQVFTDPMRELPVEFHRYIQDGGAVNFWDVTRDQLAECGVFAEHIEHFRICTSCNTDRYFSYRQEKPETGRFGSVVGIR